MKTIIISLILAAAASAQGLTICTATDATGTTVKLNTASKPICFTLTPAAVQSLNAYRAATLDPTTRQPKYFNNWLIIRGTIEELLARVVELHPPATVVTQRTTAATANAAAEAIVVSTAATASTEQ